MSANPVAWRHLGRIDYVECTALQDAVWAEVVRGEPSEVVLTLEHDPVVTVGRRGSHEDLLSSAAVLASRGVQVVEANRGGELTYHGPGQLVIYAILDIRTRGIAVGDLVRGLAGAVGDELDRLGIDTVYDAERPGLWTKAGDDGVKICAVGMRIQKGVSRHGAAVNVTTGLEAFDLFVPCGLPQASATSILAERGEAPSVEDLAERVVANLRRRLDLQAP